MEKEALEQAKILEKKIKKLKNFIDYIERIGNCSAIMFKREPRWFAKRVPLGWSDSIEYGLDKVMEERMLEVLKERLNELEIELKTL